MTALVGAVAGGLRSAARPAGATADDGVPPGTPRSARDDDQLAQGDAPSPNCPACGACQTCTIDSVTSAGTCGAPCADPCLASALCEEALRDGAYRQLADALGADGFAPAGEPQAIAIEEDGILLSERLAAEYADTQEPARAATLVFLREPGGTSAAYAVVRQGQSPLYGLVVAEDGRAERVAVDVAPGVDGTSPGARTVALGDAPCEDEDCDACDVVCSAGEVAVCFALGAKICKTNLVCHALLEAACWAVSTFGCEPFCDLFDCAVCDPGCQVREPNCGSCRDLCREQDSNSRCVDGRCRCVVGDRVGQACEPPDRCLDGLCRCIVGNAEGETCGPKGGPDYCCDTRRCERCHLGHCFSGCQSNEACCNGECRDDWVECGDTCCPFLEGLICCGAGCVNPDLNRDHCGACNSRCKEEEICDRGRCRGCDPSRCETFADDQCVVACREDEVCVPERGCVPRSSEPIDAGICEIMMTEADLLELVGGGTSVTSLTSFDAINDRGNVVVLCLWDVVGNPLSAEPWFDWLVQVQVALTVWGSEPEASWTAGLDAFEAELGCAPAELPGDRTPVCLREEPGKVDLTVRLDAYRFLWLLLTSSRTAGTPDYPELRAAAERVASFIAAQYPAP